MPTPKPQLDALRSDYQNLFDKCTINPGRLNSVDAIIAKIKANKSRYEKVATPLSIPWYFIAVIHSMECGLDFNRHLHNGDLLTAKTIHVPAGRPIEGNPPFTWEASATDALTFEKIHLLRDWTIPAILFFLEGYNGFGYRLYHGEVNTPYLWSFSNNYTSGKYGSDGKWNPVLQSSQCGAAVILKRMQEQQLVVFEAADGVIANTAIVPTAGLPAIGKVNTPKLNIRAEAGPNFEMIAKPLTTGKEVEILEEKDGWYRVRTSIEGWVSKQYINT